MTFDKVNRRTHLYLGLLLMPWFFMYAISSVALNHDRTFKEMRKDGKPDWTKLYERPYRMAPIADDADPWKLAGPVLRDFQLEGRHRAFFDANDHLAIERTRFMSTMRLTYLEDNGVVVVEKKRFHWDDFLIHLHLRGGYSDPYLVEILWALSIDIVVLSTFVWILSGLYLWWKLRQLRFWGWATLVAGTVSFALIVFKQ